MEKVDKRIIQEFWTANVPGLDIVSKKYKPDQKEFYIETDKFRYKYDSYIMPLLDSFAQKGKTILEIGCGMGADSRYIARRGALVTSLDLCFNNVSFTLSGMRLSGLCGRGGVCADAENLPFKDNSFDQVYSFGVLHHTPDTQRAINEIYRVVKPNGKIMIMLYHKGYAYFLLWILYGYQRILGIYKREQLMSKYDNTPLSKLYSKQEVLQLFCKFKNVQTTMTTYGGIQAHAVLRYLYKLLQRSKILMRVFGSFIIIKGEK